MRRMRSCVHDKDQNECDDGKSEGEQVCVICVHDRMPISK